MKSAKKIFVCIMVLVLSMFFTGSSNIKAESFISYNKGVKYEATYSVPESLEELESGSEVIVIGKYLGGRITDTDPSLIGPGSIAQFEVEQVQKGSINNETISIIEPCKFVNGNYINVDGYVPMKQGNEYILYLREINTSSGTQYTIVSGNFGKYNLSNNTALLPNPDVINNFEQVSDLDMVTSSLKKCELYNKIKSQITNETYEEYLPQQKPLQNQDALYNFRINPSKEIPYYTDSQSINIYKNHKEAYQNALEKYKQLQSTSISFKAVNNEADAVIEFHSVNSPKEEWLGIAKISYLNGSPYNTVVKSRVYLNEYNIVTYKLTKEHVYEVGLHELGHCFGLLHQDQIFSTQTIMGPYLSVKNAARTSLPTLDRDNLIYAYPNRNDWEKHWASIEINDFLGKGYINGYPDGRFLPDNPMTRAEFVVVLNKVFGITGNSGREFNDTVNHWAKDDIDIAVTNGVANGVSASEFKPDDYITREEVATMIANYKGLSSTGYGKSGVYKDNKSISSWALNGVECMLDAGYMKGYSDATFRPGNNISRAEAVVTLSRIK